MYKFKFIIIILIDALIQLNAGFLKSSTVKSFWTPQTVVTIFNRTNAVESYGNLIVDYILN